MREERSQGKLKEEPACSCAQKKSIPKEPVKLRGLTGTLLALRNSLQPRNLLELQLSSQLLYFFFQILKAPRNPLDDLGNGNEMTQVGLSSFFLPILLSVLLVKLCHWNSMGGFNAPFLTIRLIYHFCLVLCFLESCACHG